MDYILQLIANSAPSDLWLPTHVNFDKYIVNQGCFLLYVVIHVQ